MINLIGNELKKIFKKKSIYITLLITLVFIIACNVIYKVQEKDTGYRVGSEIEYYEEQLKHLNPNSEKDKSLYINLQTELQLARLVDKYGGPNTWQAQVILSPIRMAVSNMNYFQYDEKNEAEFEKAKQKYEVLVARLDSGDWRYFVQEELKDVEENLKTQRDLKEVTLDKVELASIGTQIAELEIQKQVLDWRLEREIPYGYDYFNTCLNRYSSAKQFILDYESSKKTDYQEKQGYYTNLERAAISQYDIEHGTTSGDSSDARGLLIHIFEQFEIFIMVIIIMLAGSIVSDEFSKGTVKLLLIKPYKRSTILVSKFITCLIMLVFIIIVIIGMQFIVGGFVQGFDSFSTPAVVYNHITNQVEEVNLVSYLAMQTVGKLPIYISLMTLAFALSTIFTNSALAITIGLLGYMGAPFVNMLASEFNLTWIKFFITPNWDLTQYFFGGLPMFEGLTPVFSMVIVIIYIAIMLVPTFILFQKKNIKNI